MSESPKPLQYFSSDLEALRELEVSFGIRGDTLNPENITQHLNIIPTNSFAKNDLKLIGLSNRTTPTRQLKRPWGVWQLSTKGIVHSIYIEDHLQYLLDILKPKKEQLDVYISNKQMYSVSFRIWREADGVAGQLDIDAIYLGRICQLCQEVTIQYLGNIED